MATCVDNRCDIFTVHSGKVQQLLWCRAPEIYKTISNYCAVDVGLRSQGAKALQKPKALPVSA